MINEAELPSYAGWSDPTPAGGLYDFDDPFASWRRYDAAVAERLQAPLPTFESYYASRASAPRARALAGLQAPPVPNLIRAGPPERFQFNMLDPLGQGVMDIAESPFGQFALGTLPAVRGGVTEAGWATTPVNLQNFATYAREAPLSVITSALGHRYQQPDVPYAAPAGPANTEDILRNISQGDFEGVLDNVIDGITAVGDAIVAPFIAISDHVRHSAASIRAGAVAELYSTGHATPNLLNFITHAFDLDGLTQWETIARRAAERGVTVESMIAELWDLHPDVVRAIATDGRLRVDPSGPFGVGLTPEQTERLWKLTEGEPFSYNPATNLIAELAVNLGPMLFGAGELRGIGAALQGVRAVRGARGAEQAARTLGFSGRGAAYLLDRVVPGNVVATAERIGSWSLPKAWRWIKPTARTAGALAGLTPTGVKIGGAIRAGEWAIKQAAAIAGNEEAVAMMDRWLWEMPLSNNPGLMMADAFLVNPVAGAKALGRQVRGGVVRVFGHGDVELGSRFAANIGSLRDMDIDTLQARLLDSLDWDPATVKAIFDPSGPWALSSNDLKNGLFYVAKVVVRERHPEAARIAPEASPAAREAAFTARYGEEASRLLRDELAGRSTAIREALREEFWVRASLLDGSELGHIGMPGPYLGHTALVQFASWLRASKGYQVIAEDVVAALRTDVNRDFLAAYRQMLAADYQPTAIVRAADINRLVTFIPAAKVAGRGRLGAAPKVPRVTRRQLEKILDELATMQDVRDFELSQPRSEAVPALRPAEAESRAAIALAFKLREDTVAALIRARTEGVEGLGQLPGDLMRVLQRVFRMTSEQIRRAPQAAWQRAVDWFGAQYDSAVTRGQAVVRSRSSDRPLNIS